MTMNTRNSLIESEHYLDVMGSNVHQLITRKRGRQLDRYYYGNGPLAHKTIYWGCRIVDWLPIEPVSSSILLSLPKLQELLPNKIVISEKAWHMAVTWPISWAFAGEAYRLVKTRMSIKESGDKRPTAIEMFTGAGSLLSGINNAGFVIKATIDNNQSIMNMAKHNFEVFRIKADFPWVMGSAVDYILEIADKGEKVDIVFADPEWKKKRLHDKKMVGTPFHLSDMSPEGEVVVETALKVANHVALKVPMNLNVEELKQYAEKALLDLHVLDINQPVSDMRVVRERMAFFSKPMLKRLSFTHDKIGVGLN